MVYLLRLTAALTAAVLWLCGSVVLCQPWEGICVSRNGRVISFLGHFYVSRQEVEEELRGTCQGSAQENKPTKNYVARSRKADRRAAQSKLK